MHFMLLCLKIGSDGWGLYGIFLLYKRSRARVSKKDLQSVFYKHLVIDFHELLKNAAMEAFWISIYMVC